MALCSTPNMNDSTEGTDANGSHPSTPDGSPDDRDTHLFSGGAQQVPLRVRVRVRISIWLRVTVTIRVQS